MTEPNLTPRRNRRRLLLIFAGALALLALAAVWWGGIVDNPVVHGRRVTSWLVLNGVPDPHQRERATRALGEALTLLPDASLLKLRVRQALDQNLGDADRTVRTLAAAFTPDADAQTDALILAAALRPLSPAQRRDAAAMILMQLIPDHEAMLTPMIDELAARHGSTALAPKSSSIDTRLKSLQDIINLLINRLDSDDQQERLDACVKLAAQGPEARNAIGRLLRLVREGDQLDRLYAAAALGRIGPAAMDILPDLQAQLKSRDPLTRTAVANAIGRIAPNSPMTRAGVRHQLIALDPDSRRYALEMQARKMTAPAIEALMSLLKDPQAEVRLAAVTALGRQGEGFPHVPPALAALRQDPSVDVRAAAEWAQARVCDRQSRPSLSLEDPSVTDPAILTASCLAAAELAQRGLLSAEDINRIASQLKRMLDDPGLGVREDAIGAALTRILENGALEFEPFKSPLLDCLATGDPDPWIVRSLSYDPAPAVIDTFLEQLRARALPSLSAPVAALGLMPLGDRYSSATQALTSVIATEGNPAITSLLDQKCLTPEVLNACLLSLNNLSFKDDEQTSPPRSVGIAVAQTGITPVLPGSLDEQPQNLWKSEFSVIVLKGGDYPELSPAAAMLLAAGEAGPEAAPLLPALLPMLRDRWLPLSMRWLAASAVEAIDSGLKAAGPGLIKNDNKDREAELRRIALTALTRKPLAGGNPWVVRELIRLASNAATPAIERRLALLALGRGHRDPKVDANPAIRELILAALDDPDAATRAAASRAAGWITSDWRVELIDRFGDLLRDGDPDVRLAAAVGLAAQGAAAAPATARLAERLADYDARVRLAAARALTVGGEPTQDALLRLDQAKKDPDPSVAAAARDALAALNARSR